MVPSVAQQLQAIRNTMAKTVVPALDADADFAKEQAGLILASLDWVLDVQASEYRYERVDHEDARALLEALAGLDGVADAEPEQASQVRAALDDAQTVPEDLLELRARTLRLKQLGEQVYAAAAGTDRAARARALVAAAARRQSERELAWGRMTGFPRDVKGSIAEVLTEQSEQSEQSVAGASA